VATKVRDCCRPHYIFFDPSTTKQLWLAADKQETQRAIRALKVTCSATPAAFSGPNQSLAEEHSLHIETGMAWITLLSAGDFIGEESIAGAVVLRLATATAIIACSALKIERGEMLRVLH
jgi:CRP-like cAMP-binding protein